jgi:hypothetical protein
LDLIVLNILKKGDNSIKKVMESPSATIARWECQWSTDGSDIVKLRTGRGKATLRDREWDEKRKGKWAQKTAWDRETVTCPKNKNQKTLWFCAFLYLTFNPRKSPC